MNSLVKLREEKERLARDLAESCRQFVDLQFAWNELFQKQHSQKIAFARFLIDNDYASTMPSAMSKVERIIEAKQEPYQLDLPLKEENNP